VPNYVNGIVLLLLCSDLYEELSFSVLIACGEYKMPDTEEEKGHKTKDCHGVPCCLLLPHCQSVTSLCIFYTIPNSVTNQAEYKISIKTSLTFSFHWEKYLFTASNRSLSF